MNSISGYNALVTGGTSGMGWEYCRQLASKGCNILMVSVQNDLLATLPQRLAEEYKVKSWVLYVDLSCETSADYVWDYCRQQDIEVDILAIMQECSSSTN